MARNANLTPLHIPRLAWLFKKGEKKINQVGRGKKVVKVKPGTFDAKLLINICVLFIAVKIFDPSLW